MHTNLFLVATVAWVLWATLFTVKRGAEQFHAAGYGPGNPAVFATYQFILGAAFLNFIVFFFVHGALASWLEAGTTVVGGYVASLLISAFLRFTGGNLVFLSLIARVSVVGVPAAAALLWFVR